MLALSVGTSVSRHGSLRLYRPLIVVNKSRVHCNVRVSAASSIPTATDVPAAGSTASDVKKYLLSIGWDLAWIDGITAEITKRTFRTSVAQCEAVINYLLSLGIPTHRVENMVSICKGILGREVSDLENVLHWVKKQNLSDERAVEFIQANPTILTYSPSPDGSYLMKGKARVSLSFGERNDQKVVGLVQWREGAAFKGPPVAPAPPSLP